MLFRLQVLAIIFKLGTGSRDPVSAPRPAVFATVSLGGAPVSSPLQLIKPNITFWAALEKTHWVMRDRMLSVPCFQCYFLAQRNTKS